MNVARTTTLTFDEFLQWKPENGHYELHEGIIIKMQPTGKHEEIVEFLQGEYHLRHPYSRIKFGSLRMTVGQFRDYDVIQSQVFPELELTAQQIFQG